MKLELRFYPYLISLLPFLSFINGNFQDLNFRQFAAVLIFGLVLSFSIFLTATAISFFTRAKNGHIVSLFLAISVYILFNFRFWDINKGIFLFLFITVPLLISFISSRSGNFSKIFSVSVCAMFFVSAAQVTINYTGSNSSFLPQKKLELVPQKVVLETPNVYLLILDAYSRSDELSRLDILNDYFIDHLIENGFFVAENSTTNFMSTKYVLQAMYTMDYPNLISNDIAQRNKILLGNNPVVNIFKSLGYKHVRMGPNQAEWQDCSGVEDYCLFKLNELDGTASGAGPIYSMLLKMTPLYGVFVSLFPEKLFVRLFPEKLFRNVYSKSTIDDAYRAWKQLQPIVDSPVFVELNVWQPHQPFLYDNDCELINDRIEYENESVKKGGKLFDKAVRQYGGEVHCVNRQVINFINFLNKTDPEAIIVIISDHGHQFLTDFDLEPESWSEIAIKARSSNLWAAKLPKDCMDQAYSYISVVNTFRVVFSCIYKHRIDPVMDKVYLHNNKDYEFYLYSEK